jgi:phage baseplate assembly protein W
MAQNAKYININYPFKDSAKGFFLDLTTTDSKAIKSDLMHLILTRKGERLYNPEFGSDLLKFIFEPNDGKTLSDIKLDIQTTVKKYIPNLDVDDITVDISDESEYVASVQVNYTITDGVFTETDFVIINI